MSVFQHPDVFNAQEVQVWNNAAFDNGESEDSTAVKGTWSNLHSLYVNQSLESDCSKENLSPGLIQSPVSSSLKSSIPIKPLQANCSIKNSQTKPLKSVSKLGILEKSTRGSKDGVQQEEEKRDEKKIDTEIEEIEKEINRLSSRLEALRLEKIELKSKAIEKRGRFVPAKFKEQKQNIKISETNKKNEVNLLSSAKPKLNNRRGMSLGPAEIYSAAKSRQSFGKPEMITPVQSIQNRRKSCFWKLQEIDELKVTKERGKSLSLSPRSRKTVASKVQPPKQAMTTVVASKKTMKKEDALLSLIQPKKLFKDAEKSSKKPLKPGRFVASRYNQIPNDLRKRSFPENDKEESNDRVDKRRVSRESDAKSETNKKNDQASSRVKKRWEIPTELVICKGSPPPSISKMSDVLPKIKTVQVVDESPRDSGAAKRVAELVGKKSFFCGDDHHQHDDNDDDDDVEMEVEEVSSVCQALRFDEDDIGEY